MSKNLAQIFATNPVTTIGDTDLLYVDVAGTTDAGIQGSNLIAQFTGPFTFGSGSDSAKGGTFSAANGINAIAYGNGNTSAFGDYSVALGNQSIAAGNYCLSLGSSGTQSGQSGQDYNLAFGNGAVAIGSYGFSFGSSTVINPSNYGFVFGSSVSLDSGADYAFAFGNGTSAASPNAVAWGVSARAVNTGSWVINDGMLINSDTAAGQFVASFTNGFNFIGNSITGGDGSTTNTGNYTFTFGSDETYTLGNNAFAFGNSTGAGADYAVAFGNGCSALGIGSLVFGAGVTVNTGSDYSFMAGNQGQIFTGATYSFSFGNNNNISGSYSFAFGKQAVAINAGCWVVNDGVLTGNSDIEPGEMNLSFTSGYRLFGGSLQIETPGSGLAVAEGDGSNAKQGVATLSAGTVIVTNSAVTANSRIFVTSQDDGVVGALRVPSASVIVGTSFVINSSVAIDAGVVAYEIFEPAA